MDQAHIDDMSRSVRHLLDTVCGEGAAMPADFATHVIYIPVSSPGTSPAHNARGKALEVIPDRIKPHWVKVPF